MTAEAYGLFQINTAPVPQPKPQRYTRGLRYLTPAERRDGIRQAAECYFRRQAGKETGDQTERCARCWDYVNRPAGALLPRIVHLASWEHIAAVYGIGGVRAPRRIIGGFVVNGTAYRQETGG